MDHQAGKKELPKASTAHWSKPEASREQSPAGPQTAGLGGDAICPLPLLLPAEMLTNSGAASPLPAIGVPRRPRPQIPTPAPGVKHSRVAHQPAVATSETFRPRERGQPW